MKPLARRVVFLPEAVADGERPACRVRAHHQNFAVVRWVAVRAFRFEIRYGNEGEHSQLTAVCVPERHDAGRFRQVVPETFNMSPGAGTAKVVRRAFRIDSPAQQMS